MNTNIINRWRESQRHSKSFYNASKPYKTRSDARKLLREFDVEFSDLSDSAMLEIGSGHGIIHSVPTKTGVGIDPLSHVWREKYTDSTANMITTGMGESLPYKNNTFDYVFTWNVLDHTIHPQIVLREIHRVLKQTGVLLLGVNVYRVPVFVRELLVKRLGRNHPHYFVPSDVRELLTDAGFEWRDCVRRRGGVSVVRELVTGDVLAAGSAVFNLSLFTATCRLS